MADGRMRALVVVFEKSAFYLQGDEAMDEYIKEGLDPTILGCNTTDCSWTEANGFYAIEGHNQPYRSYDGEYDCEFIQSSIRPATIEEVRRHFADEYVWMPGE